MGCYTVGMDLGERIVSLRKRRGWSQGQLLVQARLFVPTGKKLARETLSRIENGHQPEELWILQALAAALETTVDTLTGGDEGEEEREILPAEVEALVRQLAPLPRETRSIVRQLVEVALKLQDVEGDGGVTSLGDFARLFEGMPQTEKVHLVLSLLDRVGLRVEDLLSSSGELSRPDPRQVKGERDRKRNG